MSFDEILSQPVWDEVKSQYGYELEPNEMVYIWNNAKISYLQIRYPFDMTICEVPEAEKYRANGMIAKIVIDYLERRGLTSATAYFENGLKFTFDSAGISKWIRREIKSCAKTPV